MADFTTSNTTKSAVRKLAEPLADVTAFDNIVQGVVTNNPFQCTIYNAGGADHPGVERSRQGYTARVIYQDEFAKTIALITVRAPTIAAFTAAANLIVADTDLATALGGSPVRDFGNERYAATLRCHDANGEIYFVNFSREQVTLTSFSDDAIRSRVETWADTVAALS
jgi:endonuclease YncB( thermonuclease family)